MATIDDVAKQAGVSKTTVSRYLNSTAPVNAITKNKIQKAIDTLNYSPSLIAQSMRSKRTKTIGVIVPDYANPFYALLFKEIEKNLRTYGYMTLICPTDEDDKIEIENLKKLVSRQIDGILFFTYKGDKELYKFITSLSKKIPLVFMDQVAENINVSQVITDGYSGFKKAVEYFIGKGHKLIGCIKGPSKFEVTHERFKGYMDMLLEAGIPFIESLVYEGDFKIKGGYLAGKYFANLQKMPTAIVSVTDLMAIGILRYFEDSGIKVPEQVEIMGFDNISLCNLVRPPLSTVAQPFNKLGLEAVQLLMRKIQNPRTRNKTIVLDGELIIRRSTDISKPSFYQNE